MISIHYVSEQKTTLFVDTTTGLVPRLGEIVNFNGNANAVVLIEYDPYEEVTFFETDFLNPKNIMQKTVTNMQVFVHLVAK